MPPRNASSALIFENEAQHHLTKLKTMFAPVRAPYRFFLIALISLKHFLNVRILASLRRSDDSRIMNSNLKITSLSCLQEWHFNKISQLNGFSIYSFKKTSMQVWESLPMMSPTYPYFTELELWSCSPSKSQEATFGYPPMAVRLVNGGATSQ